MKCNLKYHFGLYCQQCRICRYKMIIKFLLFAIGNYQTKNLKIFRTFAHTKVVKVTVENQTSVVKIMSTNHVN